jgi:hypothetical protein
MDRFGIRAATAKLLQLGGVKARQTFGNQSLLTVEYFHSGSLPEISPHI